jgi:DNA-directed RNA polymerase subunit omega
MSTQRRASLIDPSIEDLLGRVDSKFTLVTVAARRARQINSYFNQLGDGIGTLVPPQVASVSRKPLSIALEEIVADKIEYARAAHEADGSDSGADAAGVPAPVA